MDIGIYRTDIQNLIKDIQNLRGVDSKATIDKCNQLEAFGIDHKDFALIGFARFTRGETYYLMNDLQSFYYEMLSCMSPLEKIGEWGYLAMANNLLGIMSVNRGNHPFALDHYFKAISYCRDYKLPDLECSIHMNIGSLYLNVENYKEALDHFSEGYKYITSNSDIDGYIEKLTAVCVGMGKAFLEIGDIENAFSNDEIIQDKCMSSLVDSDKIAVLCFEARLMEAVGQKDKESEIIKTIDSIFSDYIPIMDVFDDVYDYMYMLIKAKRYESFEKTLKRVEESTKKASVKNLERKLINLEIEMYHDRNMQEEYRQKIVEYYEIMQAMDKETGMMISNMISVRQELYNLTQINKKEHQKNVSLRIKSETDSLTGIANRLKLDEYKNVIFERSRVNKVGVAIALLDIDYFKEYNDNYGHQSGDKSLMFVADELKNLEKHGGIFTARYGGDEFVVIYEGYTKSEVFGLAKELKENIVKGGLKHEYSKLDTKVLTISQGIFWGIPKDKDQIDDYMGEADKMLYSVKQKSRNSIMIGEQKDS